MEHILAIKEKIFNLLQSELGQYTFANGQSVPAISVDNNGQFPPPGTVIKGLECVIIPLNNAIATRLCGSKQITYQSDILLKQWNSSSNVICATEKILAGLPEVARIGPRLLSNGELQSIEQQRITIEVNQVIRWE